jgi:16S rRNA (guanine1516-N2)-methyltransferase
MSPDHARRARTLAGSLGLDCVDPGERSSADLLLMVEDGGLSLRDNRDRRTRPLRISFGENESRSKKQLLARAVGRRTRRVVDAAAGWGEDARRLSAMGYSVTAIERHPVIAAMLSDAAELARRVGRVAVPDIVTGDAITFLSSRENQWDCVYLDPMFPPKRRSSTLAKRPLRLLRELVGNDPDRRQLFDAAGIAAGKRVVVKRPDHSPPLFGKPSEVVKGRLVCYDVYLKA